MNKFKKILQYILYIIGLIVGFYFSITLLLSGYLLIFSLGAFLLVVMIFLSIIILIREILYWTESRGSDGWYADLEDQL